MEAVIGKIVIAIVILAGAWILLTWLEKKITRAADQLIGRAASEAKKVISQGEAALKSSATYAAKELKAAIEPSVATIAGSIVLMIVLKNIERRNSQ